MDADQTAKRVHMLIKAGPTATVDWVPDAPPVETIAQILTAMANGMGGTVFVGIGREHTKTASSSTKQTTDQAHITGVESDVKAIDRVLQAALNLTPALIIPLPKVIEVDGKKLIETHIPTGMPHVYAYDGRYLMRDGHANTPLTPLSLRRLFMERGEINFENEVANGAQLDDINWKKVRAYCQKVDAFKEADPQEVLLRRGCLTYQGNTLRPTNAGILLFGTDPQRYVRGAEITAARFGGDVMSDIFTRQDLTGTLPDQIKRAETFLVDHMRKGVQLRGTMAREERHEYPMEAARELVVNAVAHRDYSVSGDSIRLFLFKNRMEVSNPGGLAGPVTIANIKDERFSRNPVIVQVLSDMGYIERLGYGVDRVIELMGANGLQSPAFEETAAGFRVTLKQVIGAAKPAPTPQIATEPAATVEVVAPTDALKQLLITYRDIPLNPRQETALAHLAKPENARITNSELQQLFTDVHPETIRRDLADMVTKEILVKKGQKRGSYYVLKRDDDEGKDAETGKKSTEDKASTAKEDKKG